MTANQSDTLRTVYWATQAAFRGDDTREIARFITDTARAVILDMNDDLDDPGMRFSCGRLRGGSEADDVDFDTDMTMGGARYEQLDVTGGRSASVHLDVTYRTQTPKRCVGPPAAWHDERRRRNAGWY